jgi:SAM-dependent methyltransferase
LPDWSDSAPVAELDCPFGCNGVRRRIVDTVWEAPEAAVYQCGTCEVVFLHPIMSEEEERAFYESKFASYMKERGSPGETDAADHYRKWQPEAARRLANLKPWLREDMEVLEIGSSSGALLGAVKPHVASVVGVEPGDDYRAYANSIEIPTHPTRDAVDGQSFDLILSYYVVEHMRDPVGELAQWRALLKPGGLLAVEVPNVDDALVRYYQVEAFDRFYWQRAHYFNYSQGTLEMVMRRAGFDEVETIPEQRYDISNHVHWMLRGEPGGMARYTDLFDDQLNAEYARVLKDHWYCDTVFAVARNPG